MKLVLPSGEKTYLDTSLTYDEKLMVVNTILDEWNDHFKNTWENNKTKTCLDILSTYLCTAKSEEDRHKEDKYVMSTTKVKKMQRGNNKVLHFNDLEPELQFQLGMIDAED